MRVLFIGGTGEISRACVDQALSHGHQVSVYNRGKTVGDLPGAVTSIVGDLSAPSYADLANAKYDVVCQFIAFTPDQVARDLSIFDGHCGQYIFISSASVYQKPPSHYVITEQTPAINPYWPYSQAKIECERLIEATEHLPWTIVRPSHTIRTRLPIMMGEPLRMARRMLEGDATIVAGDGHTPWTLTRAMDLAGPFVELFGNPGALRETFHITSDRAYLWDEIQSTIARMLGVDAEIVHVPTETLIRYNPDWEGPLLGDKAWTAIFDNSKIKRVAGDFPCAGSLEEILAGPIQHFKQHQADRLPPRDDSDDLIDRICREQTSLGRTGS